MALSMKNSPFVFTPETLDHLTLKSQQDPAVLDLVTGYRAAQETLDFYAEQVTAELTYYGVPSS